jgi:adenosine deaminase
LNVCLSSNLVHLYADAESHPFRDLHAAGVPLTINTDDPGYIGVDLADEFVKIAALMGWGLADLAGVTRRAIDATFATPATKLGLHRRLDAFLADPTPLELPS